MSNLIDAHEIELPPRVINRTLRDVTVITARHNGNAERLRQNAMAISAAEWLEDMDWLYGQREAVPLTDEQFIALREKFRTRHREVWGVYAHTPD